MKTIPALRNDLVIKEQIVDSQKSYIVVDSPKKYIIKDPVKKTYYRFEEEEYFVLSLLDGKRTSEEIAELYQKKFYDKLSPRDIEEFVVSVRSNNLLEKNPSEQNVFLYEQLREQRKSRIKQAQGSLLYFRIPVWDPDIFFNRIIFYIRWLWSKPAVIAMIFAIAWGIFSLCQDMHEVKVGMRHLFDFSNQKIFSLFILWLTIICVIAIHEIGHGLTCKRFGGECHEIGFLFMFFTPCMYTNVNDAWLFDNKRHRLFVTFAGCFIEFIVGTIAILFWQLTQTGTMLNMIAFKIIVVCFFSAIFMNFNPLMKYDGYFALSDYLEIPNLRDRSKTFLMYLIQSKIFRLNKEHEPITKREQWVFVIYGLLVMIYLTNVMLGLVLMIGGALIRSLHGLGLFLTFSLVYKFFGPLLKKGINFMKSVKNEHSEFFKRPIVNISMALLLISTIVVFIGYPFSFYMKFPAIIEPDQEVIIRASENGYITKVRSDSMSFKQGDVMIRMENNELKNQIEQITIELRINELMQQAANAHDDPSQLSKLKEVEDKLNKEMENLTARYQSLTITAPFNGVLKDKLDKIDHTWINRGTDLAMFMNVSEYKAVVEVLEKDLEGLFEGMSASFVLNDKPDDIHKGKVRLISPVNYQKGIARFYAITMSFSNHEMNLRSGLKGNAYIKIGEYTYLNRFIRWIKKTLRLDLQM